jgi:hypothetical protein
MIATHPQATTRLNHFRAYLAGTGATGSLIAGAVVVFISLAAYVAFHGMPFGGSGGSLGSAYVGSSASGPPETAAKALGAAPRSVASSPVPGAPAGAAGQLAAGPGGAPGSAVAGISGSGSAPTATTSPSGTTTSPGTPSDPSGGPITNTVNQVTQDATGGPAPSPITQTTQQAENAATSTLNDAGGAVGQPGLGDSVEQALNQTLNQVTQGLPGH